MTPTIQIRGITARIPEGCRHFVKNTAGWYFLIEFPGGGERSLPAEHPLAACVAEHWFKAEAHRIFLLVGAAGNTRRQNEELAEHLGAANDQSELWHRIAEGESDEKA